MGVGITGHISVRVIFGFNQHRRWATIRIALDNKPQFRAKHPGQRAVGTHINIKCHAAETRHPEFPFFLDFMHLRRVTDAHHPAFISESAGVIIGVVSIALHVFFTGSGECVFTGDDIADLQIEVGARVGFIIKRLAIVAAIFANVIELTVNNGEFVGIGAGQGKFHISRRDTFNAQTAQLFAIFRGEGFAHCRRLHGFCGRQHHVLCHADSTNI